MIFYIQNITHELGKGQSMAKNLMKEHHMELLKAYL